MEPELVLNDYTYTAAGRRSALGHHHDSGREDAAASRRIRAWGSPYDQAGGAEDYLTMHAEICERLLRPDRDGLPPSEAERAHLTKTLEAINAELTRRDNVFMEAQS